MADGLAECVRSFLKRAQPRIAPTMLRNFSTRGRWDGSKFYTNFQVARRDFGASRDVSGFSYIPGSSACAACCRRGNPRLRLACPQVTRLFEHIDRDGGIYRHRWGADPILFLAVTLFLPLARVLHFDDVPYLHQHLVSNLPTAPADELLLPAEFQRAQEDAEAGTEAGVEAGAGARTEARTEAKTKAGAREGRGASVADTAAVAAASTPAVATQMVGCEADGTCTPTARVRASGGVPVLIFVSNATHAAAAVDALSRWNPAAAAALAPASQCQHNSLPLRLCTPAAGDGRSDATITELMRRLPSGLFSLAPPVSCAGLAAEAGDAPDTDASIAALEAIQGSEDGAGSTAAAAAATVLHISSVLRGSSVLIACVDVTDGRTLAAALAARLRGATLLNVCDWPLSTSDELSPTGQGEETGDKLVAKVLDSHVEC